MFAIVGITGNTGSAAANALLAEGRSVRALVRDRAKAAEWQSRGVQLVEGDVADTDSLAQLFDGADGAYVMVPPSPQAPDPLAAYVQIAEATARAAKSVGLQRLVFLSSEGAHLASGSGLILGAHRAEGTLSGCVPRLTFLRPSYFQENWRSVFELARAQGILPSMLQPLDAVRAQVATADIGEAAATLLTEADPPSIVELSGPVDASANDAAAAIARALDRDVVAVPVPREAWSGTLVGAGLGPTFAALMGEMYDGINSGHVRFSNEGEARRGRRTLETTVGAWIGGAR